MQTVAAAGAYHVIIVYLCMNIRLHLTMGDGTSNTSLRCYTEKHNDRYHVCDSGVCMSVQTTN